MPKPLILAASAAILGIAIYYAFSAAGPQSATTTPGKGTTSAAAATPGHATTTGNTQSTANANTTSNRLTNTTTTTTNNNNNNNNNTTTNTSRPAPSASIADPRTTLSIIRDDAARLTLLDAIEAESTTYDPAHLPKIQPYLSDPDPEIRAAALNGIINLGDAAGAPILRDAAKTAATPQEAVELLEKAAFLELPSAPITITRRKPGAPAPAKGANLFVRPKAKPVPTTPATPKP